MLTLTVLWLPNSNSQKQISVPHLLLALPLSSGICFTFNFLTLSLRTELTPFNLYTRVLDNMTNARIQQARHRRRPESSLE